MAPPAFRVKGGYHPVVIPPVFREMSEALRTLPDVDAAPCDGVGHQLEVDPSRCLHVTIRKASPAREEFLAGLAPLVRKAQFVLAALADRRDWYNLAWRPGKRGGDLAEDALRLAALLRDPAALATAEPTDRRGR